MKKTLIYAASGLIGINLIKSLISENNGQLTLVTRRGINLEICNLMGFDISKIRVVENLEYLKYEKYDLIFHLGGSSQPELFVNNVIGTIEKNVHAAVMLVEMLEAEGTIFFASSSEVYSGCSELPCDENHLGNLNLDSGRLGYVMAKLLTEKILLEKVLYPKKVLIFRVSLVYGPGVTLGDKRVLYKFMNDALKGKIYLNGDATPIRRYLYIDDFIRQLNLAIEIGIEGVFNVGGSEATNIENLANLIAKISGAEVENHGIANLNVGKAPQEVSISNDKIEKKLGKQEVTKLYNGLTMTYKWLKDLTDLENSYKPK